MNKETVCPNCISNSNCSGPHLEKLSETYYKSDMGYFFIENQKWIFFPNDKPFCQSKLEKVLDILYYLNS